MKNKLVLAVLAAASLTASSLLAGPTTLPVSILDTIKSQEWSAIPEKLKVQYASTVLDADQTRIASWTNEYTTVLDKFKTERHKAYGNAVRDAKILRDGGYLDLSTDLLADCYTLADDKPAFVQESWVKDLLAQAVQMADKFKAENDYLKARRIYANISVLEPTESKWTKAMEEMVRRIRILTKYAPESFAPTLTREIEHRKAARKYLIATTQPTTAPTTQTAEEPTESEDQIAQNLKSDWQKELTGIKMEMLKESLNDAYSNYYKDVELSKVVTGGVSALRVIATTNGLEKAFAGIADEKRKQNYLDQLDEIVAQVSKQRNHEIRIDALLDRVSLINQQTIGLPDEVIVSEFADGAFATLDPFSTIIWPFDMEEFKSTTQGEFSGVGIQITEDDGQIKVVTPIEDSPALKNGIRAGDYITHINGKSAKGITTLQAKRQITGPTGTLVTLTIKSPDDQVKDLTLTRSIIKVASIKGWMHIPGGGWDYMLDADQKIGYVRLTNFTKESSKELEIALGILNAQGARAVILDLRGDPGGLLSAATEVADKFLSGGKIVSTQSLRDNSIESRLDAHNDADDVKLPMVVLVNQYSASASEIVSGALRDQRRATIIGERTYGKGSVQNVIPLNELQQAALKLTTSHYYLPAGKCIHREENASEWGVDPDLSVVITPEQMRRMLNARSDLDVLRDGKAEPSGKIKTQEDLLGADVQLSAALYVLRLQLIGAPAL